MSNKLLYNFEEILLCVEDPAYFIAKYVKFSNNSLSMTANSRLNAQHKDIIRQYNLNDKVLWKGGRQTYKTSLTAAYILWYALFKRDKTITIASFTNENAQHILLIIREMYANLPEYFHIRLRTNNKTHMEFANGCRILTTSALNNTIRGYTMHLLFIDDFSYVPFKNQVNFWQSLAPMVSDDSPTKIIIASSVNRCGGSDIFLGYFNATLNGLDSGYTLIYTPNTNYTNTKYIGKEAFDKEYLCKCN